MAGVVAIACLIWAQFAAPNHLKPLTNRLLDYPGPIIPTIRIDRGIYRMTRPNLCTSTTQAPDKCLQMQSILGAPQLPMIAETKYKKTKEERDAAQRGDGYKAQIKSNQVAKEAAYQANKAAKSGTTTTTPATVTPTPTTSFSGECTQSAAYCAQYGNEVGRYGYVYPDGTIAGTYKTQDGQIHDLALTETAKASNQNIQVVANMLSGLSEQGLLTITGKENTSEAVAQYLANNAVFDANTIESVTNNYLSIQKQKDFLNLTDAQLKEKYGDVARASLISSLPAEDQQNLKDQLYNNLYTITKLQQFLSPTTPISTYGTSNLRDYLTSLGITDETQIDSYIAERGKNVANYYSDLDLVNVYSDPTKSLLDISSNICKGDQTCISNLKLTNREDYLQDIKNKEFVDIAKTQYQIQLINHTTTIGTSEFNSLPVSTQNDVRRTNTDITHALFVYMYENKIPAEKFQEESSKFGKNIIENPTILEEYLTKYNKDSSTYDHAIQTTQVFNLTSNDQNPAIIAALNDAKLTATIPGLSLGGKVIPWSQVDPIYRSQVRTQACAADSSLSDICTRYSRSLKFGGDTMDTLAAELDSRISDASAQIYLDKIFKTLTAANLQLSTVFSNTATIDNPLVSQEIKMAAIYKSTGLDSENYVSNDLLTDKQVEWANAELDRQLVTETYKIGGGAAAAVITSVVGITLAGAASTLCGPAAPACFLAMLPAVGAAGWGATQVPLYEMTATEYQLQRQTQFGGITQNSEFWGGITQGLYSNQGAYGDEGVGRSITTRNNQFALYNAIRTKMDATTLSNIQNDSTYGALLGTQGYALNQSEVFQNRQEQWTWASLPISMVTTTLSGGAGASAANNILATSAKEYVKGKIAVDLAQFAAGSVLNIAQSAAQFNTTSGDKSLLSTELQIDYQSCVMTKGEDSCQPELQSVNSEISANRQNAMAQAFTSDFLLQLTQSSAAYTGVRSEYNALVSQATNIGVDYRGQTVKQVQDAVQTKITDISTTLTISPDDVKTSDARTQAILAYEAKIVADPTIENPRTLNSALGSIEKIVEFFRTDRTRLPDIAPQTSTGLAERLGTLMHGTDKDNPAAGAKITIVKDPAENNAARFAASADATPEEIGLVNSLNNRLAKLEKQYSTQDNKFATREIQTDATAKALAAIQDIADGKSKAGSLFVDLAETQGINPNVRTGGGKTTVIGALVEGVMIDDGVTVLRLAPPKNLQGNIEAVKQLGVDYYETDIYIAKVDKDSAGRVTKNYFTDLDGKEVPATAVYQRSGKKPAMIVADADAALFALNDVVRIERGLKVEITENTKAWYAIWKSSPHATIDEIGELGGKWSVTLGDAQAVAKIKKSPAILNLNDGEELLQVYAQSASDPLVAEAQAKTIKPKRQNASDLSLAPLELDQQMGIIDRSLDFGLSDSNVTPTLRAEFERIRSIADQDTKRAQFNALKKKTPLELDHNFGTGSAHAVALADGYHDAVYSRLTIEAGVPGNDFAPVKNTEGTHTIELARSKSVTGQQYSEAMLRLALQEVGGSKLGLARDTLVPLAKLTISPRSVVVGFPELFAYTRQVMGIDASDQGVGANIGLTSIFDSNDLHAPSSVDLAANQADVSTKLATQVEQEFRDGNVALVIETNADKYSLEDATTAHTQAVYKTTQANGQDLYLALVEGDGKYGLYKIEGEVRNESNWKKVGASVDSAEQLYAHAMNSTAGNDNARILAIFENKVRGENFKPSNDLARNIKRAIVIGSQDSSTAEVVYQAASRLRTNEGDAPPAYHFIALVEDGDILNQLSNPGINLNATILETLVKNQDRVLGHANLVRSINQMNEIQVSRLIGEISRQNADNEALTSMLDTMNQQIRESGAAFANTPAYELPVDALYNNYTFTRDRIQNLLVMAKLAGMSDDQFTTLFAKFNLGDTPLSREQFVQMLAHSFDYNSLVDYHRMVAINVDSLRNVPDLFMAGSPAVPVTTKASSVTAQSAVIPPATNPLSATMRALKQSFDRLNAGLRSISLANLTTRLPITPTTTPTLNGQNLAAALSSPTFQTLVINVGNLQIVVTKQGNVYRYQPVKDGPLTEVTVGELLGLLPSPDDTTMVVVNGNVAEYVAAPTAPANPSSTLIAATKDVVEQILPTTLKPAVPKQRVYEVVRNKLIYHLTGIIWDGSNQEEIANKVLEDKAIIRQKYGLPNRNEIIDDPMEYLRKLEKIANDNNILVRKGYEFELLFNKTGNKGLYDPDNNQLIVSDKLYNTETISEFQLYVFVYEHELIHALQQLRYPSMPIELQEYEAYITADLSEYYLTTKPNDAIDFIFASKVPGSLRNYYRRENIETPIWDEITLPTTTLLSPTANPPVQTPTEPTLDGKSLEDIFTSNTVQLTIVTNYGETLRFFTQDTDLYLSREDLSNPAKITPTNALWFLPDPADVEKIILDDKDVTDTYSRPITKNPRTTHLSDDLAFAVSTLAAKSPIIDQPTNNLNAKKVYKRHYLNGQEILTSNKLESYKETVDESHLLIEHTNKVDKPISLLLPVETPKQTLITINSTTKTYTQWLVDQNENDFIYLKPGDLVSFGNHEILVPKSTDNISRVGHTNTTNSNDLLAQFANLEQVRTWATSTTKDNSSNRFTRPLRYAIYMQTVKEFEKKVEKRYQDLKTIHDDIFGYLAKNPDDREGALNFTLEQAQKLSFTTAEINNILYAVNGYILQHERVESLRHDKENAPYTSPEAMWEAAFGFKPQGTVQIYYSYNTINLIPNDLVDFGRAYHAGDTTSKNIEPSSDAIQKVIEEVGGFHKNNGTKIADTANIFNVDRDDDTLADTITHEDQHGLFHNLRLALSPNIYRNDIANRQNNLLGSIAQSYSQLNPEISDIPLSKMSTLNLTPLEQEQWSLAARQQRPTYIVRENEIIYYNALEANSPIVIYRGNDIADFARQISQYSYDARIEAETNVANEVLAQITGRVAIGMPIDKIVTETNASLEDKLYTYFINTQSSILKTITGQLVIGESMRPRQASKYGNNDLIPLFEDSDNALTDYLAAKNYTAQAQKEVVLQATKAYETLILKGWSHASASFLLQSARLADWPTVARRADAHNITSSTPNDIDFSQRVFLYTNSLSNQGSDNIEVKNASDVRSIINAEFTKERSISITRRDGTVDKFPSPLKSITLQYKDVHGNIKYATYTSAPTFLSDILDQVTITKPEKYNDRDINFSAPITVTHNAGKLTSVTKTFATAYELSLEVGNTIQSIRKTGSEDFTSIFIRYTNSLGLQEINYPYGRPAPKIEEGLLAPLSPTTNRYSLPKNLNPDEYVEIYINGKVYRDNAIELADIDQLHELFDQAFADNPSATSLTLKYMDIEGLLQTQEYSKPSIQNQNLTQLGQSLASAIKPISTQPNLSLPTSSLLPPTPLTSVGLQTGQAVKSLLPSPDQPTKTHIQAFKEFTEKWESREAKEILPLQNAIATAQANQEILEKRLSALDRVRDLMTNYRDGDTYAVATIIRELNLLGTAKSVPPTIGEANGIRIVLKKSAQYYKDAQRWLDSQIMLIEQELVIGDDQKILDKNEPLLEKILKEKEEETQQLEVQYGDSIKNLANVYGDMKTRTPIATTSENMDINAWRKANSDKTFNLSRVYVLGSTTTQLPLDQVTELHGFSFRDKKLTLDEVEFLNNWIMRKSGSIDWASIASQHVNEGFKKQRNYVYFDPLISASAKGVSSNYGNAKMTLKIKGDKLIPWTIIAGQQLAKIQNELNNIGITNTERRYWEDQKRFWGGSNGSSHEDEYLIIGEITLDELISDTTHPNLNEDKQSVKSKDSPLPITETKQEAAWKALTGQSIGINAIPDPADIIRNFGQMFRNIGQWPATQYRNYKINQWKNRTGDALTVEQKTQILNKLSEDTNKDKLIDLLLSHPKLISLVITYQIPVEKRVEYISNIIKSSYLLSSDNHLDGKKLASKIAVNYSQINFDTLYVHAYQLNMLAKVVDNENNFAEILAAVTSSELDLEIAIPQLVELYTLLRNMKMSSGYGVDLIGQPIQKAQLQTTVDNLLLLENILRKFATKKYFFSPLLTTNDDVINALSVILQDDNATALLAQANNNIDTLLKLASSFNMTGKYTYSGDFIIAGLLSDNIEEYLSVYNSLSQEKREELISILSSIHGLNGDFSKLKPYLSQDTSETLALIGSDSSANINNLITTLNQMVDQINNLNVHGTSKAEFYKVILRNITPSNFESVHELLNKYLERLSNNPQDLDNALTIYLGMQNPEDFESWLSRFIDSPDRSSILDWSSENPNAIFETLDAALSLKNNYGIDLFDLLFDLHNIKMLNRADIVNLNVSLAQFNTALSPLPGDIRGFILRAVIETEYPVEIAKQIVKYPTVFYPLFTAKDTYETVVSKISQIVNGDNISTGINNLRQKMLSDAFTTLRINLIPETLPLSSSKKYELLHYLSFYRPLSSNPSTIVLDNEQEISNYIKKLYPNISDVLLKMSTADSMGNPGYLVFLATFQQNLSTLLTNPTYNPAIIHALVFNGAYLKTTLEPTLWNSTNNPHFLTIIPKYLSSPLINSNSMYVHGAFYKFLIENPTFDISVINLIVEQKILTPDEIFELGDQDVVLPKLALYESDSFGVDREEKFATMTMFLVDNFGYKEGIRYFSKHVLETTSEAIFIKYLSGNHKLFWENTYNYPNLRRHLFYEHPNGWEYFTTALSDKTDEDLIAKVVSDLTEARAYTSARDILLELPNPEIVSLAILKLPPEQQEYWKLTTKYHYLTDIKGYYKQIAETINSSANIQTILKNSQYEHSNPENTVKIVQALINDDSGITADILAKWYSKSLFNFEIRSDIYMQLPSIIINLGNGIGLQEAVRWIEAILASTNSDQRLVVPIFNAFANYTPEDNPGIAYAYQKMNNDRDFARYLIEQLNNPKLITEFTKNPRSLIKYITSISKLYQTNEPQQVWNQIAQSYDSIPTSLLQKSSSQNIQISHEDFSESLLYIDNMYITAGLLRGDFDPHKTFDPGSFEAWKAARAKSKTLETLTPESILDLHQDAYSWDQSKNPGNLRTTSDSIMSDYSGSIFVQFTEAQIAAIKANPRLKYLPKTNEVTIGMLSYGNQSQQILDEMHPDAKSQLVANPRYVVGSNLNRFTDESWIKAELVYLLIWYKQEQGNPAHDPYKLAAELQQRFISIHPFKDGNGRVSRLLMDWSLEKDGLSPAYLEDPNDDIYLSLEDWTIKVKEGSERYSAMMKQAQLLASIGLSPLNSIPFIEYQLITDQNWSYDDWQQFISFVRLDKNGPLWSNDLKLQPDSYLNAIKNTVERFERFKISLGGDSSNNGHTKLASTIFIESFANTKPEVQAFSRANYYDTKDIIYRGDTTASYKIGSDPTDTILRFFLKQRPETASIRSLNYRESIDMYNQMMVDLGVDGDRKRWANNHANAEDIIIGHKTGSSSPYYTESPFVSLSENIGTAQTWGLSKNKYAPSLPTARFIWETYMPNQAVLKHKELSEHYITNALYMHPGEAEILPAGGMDPNATNKVSMFDPYGTRKVGTGERIGKDGIFIKITINHAADPNLDKVTIYKFNQNGQLEPTTLTQKDVDITNQALLPLLAPTGLAGGTTLGTVIINATYNTAVAATAAVEPYVGPVLPLLNNDLMLNAKLWITTLYPSLSNFSISSWINSILPQNFKFIPFGMNVSMPASPLSSQNTNADNPAITQQLASQYTPLVDTENPLSVGLTPISSTPNLAPLYGLKKTLIHSKYYYSVYRGNDGFPAFTPDMNTPTIVSIPKIDADTLTSSYPTLEQISQAKAILASHKLIGHSVSGDFKQAKIDGLINIMMFGLWPEYYSAMPAIGMLENGESLNIENAGSHFTGIAAILDPRISKPLSPIPELSTTAVTPDHLLFIVPNQEIKDKLIVEFESADIVDQEKLYKIKFSDRIFTIQDILDGKLSSVVPTPTTNPTQPLPSWAQQFMDKHLNPSDSVIMQARKTTLAIAAVLNLANPIGQFSFPVFTPEPAQIQQVTTPKSATALLTTFLDSVNTSSASERPEDRIKRERSESMELAQALRNTDVSSILPASTLLDPISFIKDSEIYRLKWLSKNSDLWNTYSQAHGSFYGVIGTKNNELYTRTEATLKLLDKVTNLDQYGQVSAVGTDNPTFARYAVLFSTRLTALYQNVGLYAKLHEGDDTITLFEHIQRDNVKDGSSSLAADRSSEIFKYLVEHNPEELRQMAIGDLIIPGPAAQIMADPSFWNTVFSLTEDELKQTTYHEFESTTAPPHPTRSLNEALNYTVSATYPSYTLTADPHNHPAMLYLVDRFSESGGEDLENPAIINKLVNDITSFSQWFQQDQRETKQANSTLPDDKKIKSFVSQTLNPDLTGDSVSQDRILADLFASLTSGNEHQLKKISDLYIYLTSLRHDYPADTPYTSKSFQVTEEHIARLQRVLNVPPAIFELLRKYLIDGSHAQKIAFAPLWEKFVEASDLNLNIKDIGNVTAKQRLDAFGINAIEMSESQPIVSSFAINLMVKELGHKVALRLDASGLGQANGVKVLEYINGDLLLRQIIDKINKQMEPYCKGCYIVRGNNNGDEYLIMSPDPNFNAEAFEKTLIENGILSLDHDNYYFTLGEWLYTNDSGETVLETARAKVVYEPFGSEYVQDQLHNLPVVTKDQWDKFESQEYPIEEVKEELKKDPNYDQDKTRSLLVMMFSDNLFDQVVESRGFDQVTNNPKVVTTRSASTYQQMLHNLKPGNVLIFRRGLELNIAFADKNGAVNTLFLDVPGVFKQINDTYGYQEGDKFASHIISIVLGELEGKNGLLTQAEIGEIDKNIHLKIDGSKYEVAGRPKTIKGKTIDIPGHTYTIYAATATHHASTANRWINLHMDALRSRGADNFFASIKRLIADTGRSTGLDEFLYEYFAISKRGYDRLLKLVRNNAVAKLIYTGKDTRDLFLKNIEEQFSLYQPGFSATALLAEHKAMARFHNLPRFYAQVKGTLPGNSEASDMFYIIPTGDIHYLDEDQATFMDALAPGSRIKIRLGLVDKDSDVEYEKLTNGTWREVEKSTVHFPSLLELVTQAMIFAPDTGSGMAYFNTIASDIPKRYIGVLAAARIINNALNPEAAIGLTQAYGFLDELVQAVRHELADPSITFQDLACPVTIGCNTLAKSHKEAVAKLKNITDSADYFLMTYDEMKKIKDASPDTIYVVGGTDAFREWARTDLGFDVFPKDENEIRSMTQTAIWMQKIFDKVQVPDQIRDQSENNIYRVKYLGHRQALVDQVRLIVDKLLELEKEAAKNGKKVRFVLACTELPEAFEMAAKYDPVVAAYMNRGELAPLDPATLVSATLQNSLGSNLAKAAELVKQFAAAKAK